MAKTEIYAKVSLETHSRLDELIHHLGAPSLSALIRTMLEIEIEQMDKERKDAQAKAQV